MSSASIASTSTARASRFRNGSDVSFASANPQRCLQTLGRFTHGVVRQFADHVLQAVLTHQREQITGKKAVLNDTGGLAFRCSRFDQKTGRVALVVQVGGQL